MSNPSMRQIGRPDVRIIGTLRSLYCGSAQQVLRILNYSPASLTYIQTRLKKLADQGYLERLYLPRPSRAGSAPLLYRLGRRSLPLLRAQGLKLPYRLRPAEARAYGYLHLQHTLAVNEVLIAATLLSQRIPDLTLAEVRHERELQATPITVTLVDGRSQQVAPDAYLDFRFGCAQACILLELDRGSHGAAAWRRKLRGLAALTTGPYQERFGTTSLTLAVLTTAGKRRREQLRTWTAGELDQLGERGLGGLFCFAALRPEETSPEQLFGQPHWWEPFQDSPIALLDLPLSSKV